MGSSAFTTTLQVRGPAAAVVLDDAPVQAIAEEAKRFPVVATVNGYTWRTSVARMRSEFLLGLNHAVREAARVRAVAGKAGPRPPPLALRARHVARRVSPSRR